MVFQCTALYFYILFLFMLILHYSSLSHPPALSVSLLLSFLSLSFPPSLILFALHHSLIICSSLFSIAFDLPLSSSNSFPSSLPFLSLCYPRFLSLPCDPPLVCCRAPSRATRSETECYWAPKLPWQPTYRDSKGEIHFMAARIK